MNEEKIQLCLKSWRNLAALSKNLTETEAYDLLMVEKNNRKRKSFVVRLHQVYCGLRSKRERENLLREIEIKWKL